MLEGKQNRRLYMLIHKVGPYFKAKHNRQQFWFEGPALELQRRTEIQACALTIAIEDITELTEGQLYSVRSQSNPKCTYSVDIDTYTCDCDGFPMVSFCKHLCAVQTHYLETVDIQPFTSVFPSPTLPVVRTHNSIATFP